MRDLRVGSAFHGSPVGGRRRRQRDVDLRHGRRHRRLPVGTRVSSLPVLATPADRKIIGQNPESPGGFGEYFLLDEAITRVVVSDLPSQVVCVADAISVGWSAASRARLAGAEAPMIIGCGAIGLSVIARLKLLGAGPIVAVDFVASRRDTARAMGADVTGDPAESSPYQAWRDAAGGRAGCVVFECVGVPGVLDSIISGCERGTRIFSAGGPPEGDHLRTLTTKRKGLNIQFGGGRARRRPRRQRPRPHHRRAVTSLRTQGNAGMSQDGGLAG